MPPTKKPLHGQETPLHFQSGEDYFPARRTIKLEVVVHPVKGTALNYADSGKKGTFRRQDKVFPLEPPPVVKLVPPEHNRLLLNNSPNLFCVATLKSAKLTPRSQCSEDLEGSRVVSLTKLKRTNTFDELGVFVFSSLHVKNVGDYYLDFNLFEMVISGQGMCAMHIATEHSRKFTIYPKAGDLGSPISDPLVKEMLNQGIKMRIRKVGRPNKKPKQSWECTLEEVRNSNSQQILGTLPAEPNQREDPDATTAGTDRSMSNSSHLSNPYPPMEQHYNRSLPGVMNQTYISSALPPPLQTPMYPPPRPGMNMSNTIAMTCSGYPSSLTATHIDTMSHSPWMPGMYNTGMSTSGAFGTHSLDGQDFSFQQPSNNNIMGYPNTTTPTMQPPSYAIPNHFSQPHLSSPTYMSSGQDHYVTTPTHYGQEYVPFEAGHGGYGTM